MAGTKRDEQAHVSKGYDRRSNGYDRVEKEERDCIEMQNRDEEQNLKCTSPNGNAGEEEKSEQKSLSACSKYGKPIIGLGLGLLLIIICILAIFLSIAMKNQKIQAVQTGTSVPLNCQSCPSNWTGYGEYCYKLSGKEKNWTESQNFCVLHNASLAKITEENMGIMKMFTRDHVFWIGLKRELVHLWKWLDGENATVEIMGNGGDCAYLDHDRAFMSVRCSTKHYFMCQKKNAPRRR